MLHACCMYFLRFVGITRFRYPTEMVFQPISEARVDQCVDIRSLVQQEGENLQIVVEVLNCRGI